MFPENRMLEVLIIGALALIVVGPKDLPVLMRRVGQFVGKMRAMAAEFRASFDELARQSELDELRKEVEALRQHNPVAAFHPMADPHVAATFSDIDQGLSEPMAPLSHDPTIVEAPVEPAPAPIPPPTSEDGAAAPIEPAPKPKRAPRKPRAKVSDAP